MEVTHKYTHHTDILQQKDIIMILYKVFQTYIISIV